MGTRLRGMRGTAKRLAFRMAPLVFLVLTGELVVRVKYFLLHQRDWNYLTMPIRVRDTQKMDHSTAPATQVEFKRFKPCADRKVFSEQYQTLLDYTWDDHCFRGDRVAGGRRQDELRIFVVGGSVVEDSQSDAEMLTAQIKSRLPATHQGKPIKVVNAGQAAIGGSRDIYNLYARNIRSFAPDLVLYYEAIGEQVRFSQFMQIDSRLGAITGGVHSSLFYRSAVYTYLVEKYAFSTTKAVKFWKIDQDALQSGLLALARDVAGTGGRFVFVTQALNFPRYWRGVDTFDYRAVEALLDRLKADRTYVYDVNEIGPLNQRLAVLRSLDICRQNAIPAIDVLPDVDALAEGDRKSLFLDMVHLTWKGDQVLGQIIGRKLAGLL